MTFRTVSNIHRTHSSVQQCFSKPSSFCNATVNACLQNNIYLSPMNGSAPINKYHVHTVYLCELFPMDDYQTNSPIHLTNSPDPCPCVGMLCVPNKPNLADPPIQVLIAGNQVIERVKCFYCQVIISPGCDWHGANTSHNPLPPAHPPSPE